MTKIYYASGHVHEDGDGKPPARGVQVILQVHPEKGPYFQSGDDYYVNQDGTWVGVDIFGLFDYLMESGLVLFGRTITNEEYKAIYERAKGDKVHLLAGERRPV